jgi:hypothetical protein
MRGILCGYTSIELSVPFNSVLAEGFTFGSPVDVPSIDIKEYKERCWPNSANIKKFDIDKLVVDGDNVFVNYHCTTLNDKVFWNIEYFTLKDGKIKERAGLAAPIPEGATNKNAPP